MSELRSGDLAVCVNDDVINCPDGYHVHLGMAYKRGAVLRVSAAQTNPDCGCAVVLGELEGDPSFQGGLALRFRKINPCEEEFTTLVKRTRVPERTP